MERYGEMGRERGGREREWEIDGERWGDGERARREGESNSIVVSTRHMAIPRNAFLDDICGDYLLHRS